MLQRDYRVKVNLQTGKVKHRNEIVFYRSDVNINTMILEFDRPVKGFLSAYMDENEVYFKEIIEVTKEYEIQFPDREDVGIHEVYLEIRSDTKINALTQITRTENFKIKYV